jgi:hypothetical protein
MRRIPSAFGILLILAGCGQTAPSGNGAETEPAHPAVPPAAANHLLQAERHLAIGKWGDALLALDQASAAEGAAAHVDRLRGEIRAARQRFAATFNDPNGGTRLNALDHSDHSYELYVPPTYDADTPHPILYIFSPDGNGKNFLLRIWPAAEKTGWILAASNNSRNGPWATIFEAQDVMLADTENRLNLHPTQRYATGFSGGARASLALAFRHPGKVAGVMAMGAGWPINTDLQVTTPNLAVYILIGREDSNRRHDIPDTIRKLRAAGLNVNTVQYPGGHAAPSPAFMADGLQWLARNSKG